VVWVGVLCFGVREWGGCGFGDFLRVDRYWDMCWGMVYMCWGFLWVFC